MHIFISLDKSLAKTRGINVCHPANILSYRH